jgi:hypothetical protein
MSALFIGEREKAMIAAAIERARDMPLPLAFVRKAVSPDKPHVALADRPPGFKRPQSEIVELPIGYRANFSFEEQPAGLCRHLSVSVDRPGMVPSLEAFAMIAAAFGFSRANQGRVWFEEFQPGQSAINIVQLDEPTG